MTTSRQDANKSTRKGAWGIATLLGLLPIGLAMIPTMVVAESADFSCSDDKWGSGWEYPDCRFACNSGMRVSVYIDTSEHDYVEGRGECGGGVAECVDWDGQCGFDGTVATTDSTVGECSGSAYHGGWPNTVDLSCHSAYVDNTVGQLIEMLLGTLSTPLHDDGPISAALCAPLTSTGASGIIMRAIAGINGSLESVTGMAFGPDGCMTVPVQALIAPVDEGSVLTLAG